MKYNSGYAPDLNSWIGKFSNKSYKFFARHINGKEIDYRFNKLGYRGNDHYPDPEISIFGSSFSFGVGIEHSQCWHQLLGNYRVNSYAVAGILATNNDIINHYNTTNICTGITIIQLRESKYNTGDIVVPNNTCCFIIDEFKDNTIPTFTWSSFIDRAEDGIHPGPRTHLSWAKIIKRMFSL